MSLGLAPTANASLWTTLSFAWVDPLMATGNAKPLELPDLPVVREEDRMANLSAKFHQVRRRTVTCMSLGTCLSTRLRSTNVHRRSNLSHVK